MRSHRVAGLGGCPTGTPVGGVTSTSTLALWPCAVLWPCTFCSDRLGSPLDNADTLIYGCDADGGTLKVDRTAISKYIGPEAGVKCEVVKCEVRCEVGCEQNEIAKATKSNPKKFWAYVKNKTVLKSSVGDVKPIDNGIEVTITDDMEKGVTAEGTGPESMRT